MLHQHSEGIAMTKATAAAAEKGAKFVYIFMSALRVVEAYKLVSLK